MAEKGARTIAAFTKFHGLFLEMETRRLQNTKNTSSAEKFCPFRDKIAYGVTGQHILLQKQTYVRITDELNVVPAHAMKARGG